MKLKLLIILIALLQPIAILLMLGDVNSLSMSWGTKLQPLFIFTNATTSYYFFQIDRWKIPALLLMLLTAFSINIFPDIHNITALLFFIFCIFGINRGSYWWLFVLLYLLAIPIYFKYNLFWCEFYAIIILCSYHSRLIIIANKINNIKDLIDQ